MSNEGHAGRHGERERLDGGKGDGDGGWAMETETNGRPVNQRWKKVRCVTINLDCTLGKSISGSGGVGGVHGVWVD